MPTAIVLNLPEHGHINATLPVVAELVRRGERVVYFATEPFRKKIEATGAQFADYGNAEAFRPPAHRGGLYSVMAYLMGLAEEILPALLKRIQEERPDYLLIDSMCVWGNLIRQILAIPAVNLASVFVPNDSAVTVEEMVQQNYGHAPKEVLLAGIEALDAYLQIAQRIDLRYGTRSPNIVEFFANRQPLNIVFTSRYFHLEGDRYDDTYKFVGPSIAPRGEDRSFRVEDASREPLIYISLGTIYNNRPEFLRACFRAFEHSKFQVVLSMGDRVDRSALEPIPKNFLVREYVPQLEVLERASLFLTHAGMNSASEALWHKVPLLMFPQHGDQHLVAKRVSELGAGLCLTRPEPDSDTLGELSGQILSQPEFRREAAKIAESFHSAGGFTRAAEEILAFRSR
ncbi:MAG TPA: macrolide family glycosyltransferase [Bryobacteraceae bacterium]